MLDDFILMLQKNYFMRCLKVKNESEFFLNLPFFKFSPFCNCLIVEKLFCVRFDWFEILLYNFRCSTGRSLTCSTIDSILVLSSSWVHIVPPAPPRSPFLYLDFLHTHVIVQIFPRHYLNIPQPTNFSWMPKPSHHMIYNTPFSNTGPNIFLIIFCSNIYRVFIVTNTNVQASTPYVMTDLVDVSYIFLFITRERSLDFIPSKLA